MNDVLFSRETEAFAAHARARRRRAKHDSVNAPFATKYRPTRFADVVGHVAIVARLQEFVRLGRVPHLLFDGPPGVGKTTCGKCLAREVLQADESRAFLWLNASDDRTATFVRTKLATFVSKMMTLPAGRKRVVFLDEVDSMAPDAQRLLKRMMEAAADAVTFVLACNDLGRITEGLQASCVLFRFAGIRASDVSAEVLRVAALERLAVDGTGLRAIVAVADGDLRKGLNVLHLCAREAQSEVQVQGGVKVGGEAKRGGEAHGGDEVQGASRNQGEARRSGVESAGEARTEGVSATGSEKAAARGLTGVTVYRLCEVPDASSIMALMLQCMRGDVRGALRTVKGLADDGHSPHDVFQALHQVLRTRPAAPGMPAASGRRHYFDSVVGVRLRHAALAAVSTAINDCRPRISGPFYNAPANGVTSATRAQLFACVAHLCELLSSEVQARDSLFVQFRGCLQPGAPTKSSTSNLVD